MGLFLRQWGPPKVGLKDMEPVPWSRGLPLSSLPSLSLTYSFLAPLPTALPLSSSCQPRIPLRYSRPSHSHIETLLKPT